MDSEELRVAKNAAHQAFDVLWRSGSMKRDSAYRFLAQRMGLSSEACHIGLFNAEQCARVVEICKPFAAFTTSSGVPVSGRPASASRP